MSDFRKPRRRASMSACLGLALSAACLFGAEAAYAASPSEQAILDFENTRREAVANKDIKALDAMSAAALFYVDAHGLERRRKDYLDHIAVEKIIYNSYSLDGAKAKVYGDLAVATGIFNFDVSVEGRRNKGSQFYTAVYLKENDRWKLLIWHPTVVAKPAS